MKKFVFGCLGLALVLGLAALACTYYFVWRPAKAYFAEAMVLQEIPKIEAGVKNTATFSPPANGELTALSVERFVRVQDAIEAKLGVRLKELEVKYRSLKSEVGPERPASLGTVIDAAKDLAALVVEAKRMQVDALNAQQFSMAEYEWTRTKVYQASGLPYDPSIGLALRALADGKQPNLEALKESTKPVVPPKNQALVSPYEAKLRARAPLAYFGL